MQKREDYNLKPCPFCDGDAVIKEGEECAVAQCLRVSAHRLFVDGDNNAADEATKLWNMRPIEAPEEPNDTMAQEGFKELPVEGPVSWVHLLNVYRTMIATGRIQAEAWAEQDALDNGVPMPKVRGE